MTSKPTGPAPPGHPVPPAHWPSALAADGQDDGIQAAGNADATSATLGYLGAILFGPLIPLAVYVFRRNKSEFMRYHAATAVNLSMTGLLYGLCCVILGGLLLLDSLAVALIVVLPVGFVIWVSMLRHLIRGVSAANRGEQYEAPGWICARLVRLGPGALKVLSACGSPCPPGGGRGG